jgi:hypothetical protein
VLTNIALPNYARLPIVAQSPWVSDGDLAQVKLKRHDFHGDWNYTIKPRK